MLYNWKTIFIKCRSCDNSKRIKNVCLLLSDKTVVLFFIYMSWLIKDLYIKSISKFIWVVRPSRINATILGMSKIEKDFSLEKTILCHGD